MSSGTLKAGVKMTSQVDVIESSAMSDSSSPDASSVDVKTRSFDSAAIFDSPLRKPLKINPFFAAFNITLAFGLIGALIAGYCIGLRVFDLDITAVGLYGTILISEYLIQLTCAIINRFDIDRIAADGTPEHNLLNPGSEVSIAVVGYREDEQAWRLCLRSLQTQSLRPKCVIGVVDGNEEPDLSMAQAFVEEFESYKAPLIHLPILLSEFWHYLVGRYRPGHEAALAMARQVVIEQVMEWDEKWNISSLKAVMFSQPHGHKRTAMFTAFAMSLYACRTRDSIFTTDSDTLIQPNGLDEMLALLRSAPQIGGVTADVKIWNRAESLLARLCSARYWFAFNIERACQSLWRCVGCLSGPMSMYRASDLETILGPWNLQTFGGKETTFGDDRHLTNQLLAHGLRTRYTHRTWCDSESPTSFVRWVAQQTRWSKSFFREAFWFPATFALQSPWMLVETTVQALYPFILIATVFHFLFDTTSDDPWRPIIWLVTMFGVAFVKSALAVLISRDLWLLLFSAYGFIYFFGLLPSKIYALITMNQTSWGTSARSSTERKRGQSFLQRSFHICHLVIWYTAVFVGIGFFTYRIFGNPLYFLIGAFALIPSALLYWERSLSLDGLKGLFRKKKPAPEPVTTFEVDESMLPTKPSPASKSQGDLSVASTHRSSDSTLKNTPAMSVNEISDTIEKNPDKTEKNPDTIEKIPKAATSD
ncbi:hyaluronan synthase 2 [Ilyonectria destructans]|nr:hyaluronan synthase 2 [Ilyonectria destructans]